MSCCLRRDNLISSHQDDGNGPTDLGSGDVWMICRPGYLEQYDLRFLGWGAGQHCWLHGPRQRAGMVQGQKSGPPSPGGCQLKLSWLSSCFAGGIPGWPLDCNSGCEVPFGSHNKLYMKCQSTGSSNECSKMCCAILAGDTLWAAAV